MMWWYGGPCSWMGGVGLLFMFLFWILIIFGVVYLIRSVGFQRKEGQFVEKTPLQILQERYAKGEIDKKEYEEKKKELS